ncbi:MAG: hypothetical protein F6K40_35510 [Okeania sp. SIO3I5]|uniref:hypothetical protein n=1 Tax=Okeania sp. SIO3I5 TaxID=2607805 RepID=UPI0013BA78E1|nr:hypothetical protein [Okeania sp. SIO3I5]NEQ41224.1 hypothetical protein [Okeania sp. SIO3I5]
MNTNTENESTNLHSDLQSLADLVKAIAENNQDDPIAILAILRTLELLHQELREGSFQQTLPDNRQALYNLLKDIETKGGWPYIPRLRLRYLLENWSDNS